MICLAIMHRTKLKLYFSKCAQANVPPSIALSAVLNHYGMKKSANVMKKKAWDPLTAILQLGSGIGLGWMGRGVWDAGDREKMKGELDLLREKANQKGAPPSATDINNRNWSLGGAAVGGIGGYKYGPLLFNDLEPDTAKLVGAGAGALTGAVAAPILRDIFTG